MIVRPKTFESARWFFRSYLFERHDVCAIKLELGYHRECIVRFGIIDVVALQSIQRHEGHSTGLVSVHRFQDSARRVIIVHDNMEQTVIS